MKRESAPQEYTCRNCPERYYHAIPAPQKSKGLMMHFGESYCTLPKRARHLKSRDLNRRAPFRCPKRKAPNTLLFTDIPNHYEFIKVDEDGCPMEGVKFALEDEDGNVLRELASGEDDIVRADDLKPGVYVIREIETQAGYRLTEETIRVVIDENYIAPDELFRLVNFPEEERPKDEIQTGVDVPVTPMMLFGVASVICGMAIFVLQAIKKRRMRSID